MTYEKSLQKYLYLLHKIAIIKKKKTKKEKKQQLQFAQDS